MSQGVISVSCAGTSQRGVEEDLNRKISSYPSKYYKIQHARVYHDADYILDYRGEATLVRRDYL